jgi:hypothetical protein
VRPPDKSGTHRLPEHQLDSHQTEPMRRQNEFVLTSMRLWDGSAMTAVKKLRYRVWWGGYRFVVPTTERDVSPGMDSNCRRGDLTILYSVDAHIAVDGPCQVVGRADVDER